MSTRRVSYYVCAKFMDEVGRDAARFFLFMRQVSAHLDFDLALAKTKSGNPVYIFNTAHARIDKHIPPCSGRGSF